MAPAYTVAAHFNVRADAITGAHRHYKQQLLTKRQVY